MKRLSKSEVEKILKDHELWLKTTGESEYVHAVFADVNLSGMDFRGLDLDRVGFVCVDLRNADFRDASLRDVRFLRSDLANTDFRNGFLSDTDFRSCILSNADFRNARLHEAIISNTTLLNADFRGADLTGSDLDESNTDGMIYDETTLPAIACPEKGSFIGYKKAFSEDCRRSFIVELEIPEDAKRSSATGNKCRCSKAEVLSITKLNGAETDVTKVRSTYNPDFTYQPGETVEVPDFDECRWQECAPGIHFFMDRKDAANY